MNAVDVLCVAAAAYFGGLMGGALGVWALVHKLCRLFNNDDDIGKVRITVVMRDG